MFGTQAPLADEAPLSLPRGVADLVGMVVPHRDPERYALLYDLIWRILHGERRLLEVSSDPLVHRLERMRKAIARDLHKMHAFLRFRRVEGEGPERFVAWFEPDHHILAAAAPFFVGRFRSLTWSILTPEGSAHWDGATLAFGPAGRREDAPAGDGFEVGWRDYYESTFQPRPHQPRRHAGGDAEEILAQPARDRRDSGPRPAGGFAHRRHDREEAADAGQAKPRPRRGRHGGSGP